MSTLSAYPLQWPSGWPREGCKDSSRFKTTLPAAISFLKGEVEKLGGTNLVLSSNVTLGSENPTDKGVVAYFQLRTQNIAIPCDRWNRVCDNVKAIAFTIEAMRGMERWGAKHMITAMFKGFKALPQRTGPSCWEVLGVSPEATEKQIMDAFILKAQKEHPDKGGTHEGWLQLDEAKQTALSTVRSR